MCMKNYFIPTEHNNYKAEFLKTKFIYIFILIIFVSNSILPAFTFAVNLDISIGKLLAKHNDKRLEFGLKEFKMSEKLNQSAQQKADAMLNTNCWSHYCPDGKSPWDFFIDVGYDYIHAGENLAEGFSTVERAMLAWFNSPSHRANILKDEFEEIGFGIATGNFLGKENNTVIVVHFGKERLVEKSTPIIAIESPKDGEVVNDDFVDLKGKAKNVEYIDVIVNEEDYGSIPVNGGIFTSRIDNLNEGFNRIGVKPGNINSENTISVSFIINKQQTLIKNASILQSSSHYVNYVILLIIVLVLILDFYYVFTTRVVRLKHELQHYHLGLMLVVLIMLYTNDVFSSIVNKAISI